jgi:hypothetical protein
VQFQEGLSDTCTYPNKRRKGALYDHVVQRKTSARVQRKSIPVSIAHITTDNTSPGFVTIIFQRVRPK